MSRFDVVSPRARRTLFGVLRGFSNKEIADIEGLSTRTVEFYVSEIFRVLEVDSRAEVMAIRIAELETEAAEAERKLRLFTGPEEASP